MFDDGEGDLDGVHQRLPDEYVRPAGKVRLLNVAINPNPDDDFVSYTRYVRGTFFNPIKSHGYKDGDNVEVELVPEPRNPWDPTAVAVDLDGTRIGYLPAGDAEEAHDPIRAANIAGYAVWTEARLEVHDGALSAKVVIAPYQAIRAMGTTYGLADQVEALLADATPETRWRILSRRNNLPHEDHDRLTSRKHLASGFSWVAVDDEIELPASLHSYLSDLYFKERLAWNEAKARERRERDDDIENRWAAGHKTSDIPAQSISTTSVRKVLRDRGL